MSSAGTAAPARKNRKWVSIAVKVSAAIALLCTSAMILAYLMADSGRPVTEWAIVYALAILSVALLFALFLDRVVTIPLRKLSAHASRMSKGDYGQSLSHPKQDEVGELFEAIEFLRVSFLRQKEALEDLNRSLDAKVEERTMALSNALNELKTAQEALIKTERLASIGGLAGGVAHEINNPTGVILTRAGFLLRIAKDEKLSDDVVEDLQAIHKQAERIARITGSLLSFSRQAPGPKGPVSCDEIFGEAISLLEPSIKDKPITLVRDLAPGLPAVIGDKGRLEQVILNLAKNAVDAMPAGGTLTLAASAVNGEVRIQVSDTGGGIPPEVREKIFEPFFTTKEVGKGTGLGLAIVHGIVTEHGGTIHIASTPGKGTEFSIVLPAAKELAAAKGELSVVGSGQSRG